MVRFFIATAVCIAAVAAYAQTIDTLLAQQAEMMKLQS